MAEVILVRIGEMHLKGRNRPFFEKRLYDCLQKAMMPFGGRVQKGQGRMYVYDVNDMTMAIQAACRVFGIRSVSPAITCDKDLQSMATVAMGFLSKGKGSFRVSARRADKQFPMSSDQLAAKLGAMLLERCPNWVVDLHHMDVEISVEVREQTYVYARVFEGAGGMPGGTNGQAMLLLSGGIDSPVAGYMIAKRGVRLDAVYFHAFPYTSDHAREKVVSLAKVLSGYDGPIKLHVVPFTKAQLEIRDKCNATYGTILMRRMMMRVAQSLAESNGCKALVTGESIGQVASQTMDGLYCTDDAVTMPVFRPCIGMDKLDIMNLARKIGSYDISILPYEDCCTVFTPKNPVTHPNLDRMRKAERVLDIDAMVAEAVENTQTEWV